MKIQIIKSKSPDPVWQGKYEGKIYDAEEIKSDTKPYKYYRLKDGSCWLPEEVEVQT